MNDKALANQKMPSDEKSVNFETPCVLDDLCGNFSGQKDEVKTIREHTWKPHIKKLFVQKVSILILLRFYLKSQVSSFLEFDLHQP